MFLLNYSWPHVIARNISKVFKAKETVKKEKEDLPTVTPRAWLYQYVTSQVLEGWQERSSGKNMLRRSVC